MIKTKISFIPTYILTDDSKIEDIKDKVCFIIAKDGFYHKRSNDFYNSLTKVDNLPGLLEVKDYATETYPRLPFGMIKQIEAFFQKIEEKFQSEVAVILYYSSEEKKWHVHVPDQEVSGAGVDYNIVKKRIPKGYKQIGSIHSHSSMDAFHSGTDDTDEFNFDGIHITIGRLDKDKKQYSTRFIISGKAFQVDIISILSNEPYPHEVPKVWFKFVKERCIQYVAPTYSPHGELDAWNHGVTYTPNQNQKENGQIPIPFNPEDPLYFQKVQNMNVYNGIYLEK